LAQWVGGADASFIVAIECIKRTRLVL